MGGGGDGGRGRAWELTTQKSKRGQKSNLYARGGMKSIEIIRKIMRRSSLSFTGNFFGLLSFAARTDSALGLGRLTEEATSPGSRSKADFRFGVTQIRSLCYLVFKVHMVGESPVSHQGEVHLRVLWVAHLHFVIPVLATLPSLCRFFQGFFSEARVLET